MDNTPESNQSVPEQQETDVTQENISAEPEAGPVEPAPSPMAMVAGVYLDPVKTGHGLQQRTYWAVPLIIVLVVMALGQFITFDIQYQLQREIGMAQISAMQESGRLPAEQAEAQLERLSQPPTTINMIMSVGGMLIGTPIVLLIYAALMLLVGNVILGGSARFKQFWAMVWYGSLIGALGQIIKSLVILAKGDAFGAQFGLGLFLEPSVKSIPFMISQFVDVFMIWEAVVVGVMLSILTNTTRGKGIAWALAVYILFGAAFGTLSALPALVFG